MNGKIYDMSKEVPYDLIAKVLSGEGYENEKNKLEAWIKESKENSDIVNQIKDTWLDTSPSNYTPDVEHALSKVNNQINTMHGVANKSINQTVIFRIAAVLIIGLGIFGVYKYVDSFKSKSMIVLTAESSPEVKLPDGSVVSLNKNASISYPKKFENNERRVELIGEAYFEITPDKRIPFIIECSNTITRVVGTKFNIYSSEKDSIVRITVTEGIVSLNMKTKTKADELFVEGGEVGKVNKEKGILTKSVNEDLNFLAWKTGVLTFKETKISGIIGSLSSFYSKTFVVENPADDSATFDISFDINSFDEAIETMEIIMNVDIVEANNQYILKQKL